MEIIKEKPEENKKLKKKFKIKKNKILFKINLLIVILVILFVIYEVYFTNFLSLFNSKESFEISGEINNFNIPIEKNLTLESTNFDLNSSSLYLKSQKGDIKLINFNGNLFLKNKTLYLKGRAKQLLIDKNRINNINNFTIKFNSLNVPFENLSLNIRLINGEMKLKSLEIKFNNASAKITNFSGELILKNNFILQGKLQNLEFNTKEITINKKENNLINITN